MGSHEDYSSHAEVQPGSDRVFGIVVGGIFCLFGLLPLRQGNSPRLWILIPGAVLVLVGVLRPISLHSLNVLWMRLGLLLGRVVNPVITGILFFVVITPLALLMRLAGKDPLRLRREPEAPTYWIDRSPPGPDGRSMKNQF